MKIDVQIEGADAMRRELLDLREASPSAAASALYEEGFRLDADMVPRIPVDTGRLRSTHYVAPPTQTGDGIVVEVGVGTDYAVPVHERAELRHSVGEAKFLSNAIASVAPGMGARLGAAFWRHLERGTLTVPIAASPPPAPAQVAGERRGRGRTRNRKQR